MRGLSAEMRDRLIVTLPIAPYAEMSVGKMTTPILGESLAKSMNCKFIMSINLLSTYQNRESNSFLELMKEYNINPDFYWIDKEHISELIEKVYYLINVGYIEEKIKSILLCDCGRVEIDKENLSTINYASSLIDNLDGKYYCKHCKKECNLHERKVMVFNSSKVNKSNMKFYPDFINKDRITFDNTVGTNDIIISRKRSTGIIIEINNSQYNLDIDFLWEIFLSLFDNQEKIVMCCNRQLYQLYMVGMLEKCFNDNPDTICLATPYLEYSDRQDELLGRRLSLKIYSLLVLKWAKKDNVFDESLLKYINSMNVEKKELFYNIILDEINCNNDINEDLRNVLTKKYNFQNANMELKRRRKNV